MNDETRARARQQYFGPEMLDVIRQSMLRIDEEIRSARSMDAAEVTALLLGLAEPLREIRDRIEADD